MAKAKIAVNGYGTIGKRVADAVKAQDDMEIIGVSKTRPNYEAIVAQQLGYDIYAPAANLEAFEKAGVPTAGTIEEMVEKADLVVDCTPGGVGEQNKPMYEKAGVKAIWQGGESHPIAGFSFNAVCNYEQAIGRDLVRVVSCNTTALCRVIFPIDKELGVKKVRAILARRAADPNDVKKGPINAIVPDPAKLPSHHGPDVRSVLPNINITSAALKIPTTLMHVHTVNMELNTNCTAEDVKNILGSQSRIHFVGQGISSTAEIIEFARDIGRPRNDMWENCIWPESVTVTENELYFFQAVHQESIVVPENVDAIRAMMELESDGAKSIEKTNKALGL
ncbi:MAG: type II glyceraldehyde-3-phosphate dehydrogenase [Methanosarcina thermophila]|jgi:glyceraldehyde-3-phosphate dehydrogenase (NAD(P))|uniref:Glyceraldehyde-3-phosphate dehydrogenase n=3 Tax=Methanosarcina thermophila TaxID=2210 RepID=A0A1I7ACC0_METTE|nr:type II glyceraldehyde-3-phosphate dehydrogenase [Methanosarcina thermophila]ALK06223.1 MAG: glyceraldehyde-3-phosphate dehydrogenase [Methanosarcina sp. 795]AKB12187.1 NAD(P)-dependent glyceraldehyde 3-phosphate dehydrogenase archaeal [Methanosarcina thermophila TM-1]AKB14610.1 NAD(P)-dependent glyceraldehyde 3-phosphate dehydrogenase archaeal [Methanosarcina thermophila CHTI-55]NLU57785.1 type II glyceraldehyde-3-phosphate dehydrogenase [Methanosarcina thermophila]SFT72571.1 glyceraldehyd